MNSDNRTPPAAGRPWLNGHSAQLDPRLIADALAGRGVWIIDPLGILAEETAPALEPLRPDEEPAESGLTTAEDAVGGARENDLARTFWQYRVPPMTRPLGDSPAAPYLSDDPVI